MRNAEVRMPPVSCSIRPYKAADFSALASCIERLVGFLAKIDRWDAITIPTRGYGERYAKELLRQTGKDGRVFVALERGTVVGAIMGKLEPLEKRVSCDRMLLRGRVLALYVSSSGRGKGTGTKLLAAMEGYFRRKRCAAILIEIFAPNKPAFDFYVKNGYEDYTHHVIKRLKLPPLRRSQRKS